ncbi:siroheme decarboxylase subunit beta [Thermodesulfatator autotrophicus]|uniref:siroheme decarboxylase n=1 Tax=Thermodesulfatator autotrophicus TaxID=1795632 RepID=A0A177E8F3_9BACT|nr:AsnC family transcriptional regulator [Thermodesulfatator autotrophicus]OAG28185.1 transcriptional regulator [Thermodesulfatator autotrophicus]
MLDNKDKKIIAALSEGLPLTLRPYQALADELGISEEELFSRIKKLKEKGIIRRLGGTIRHDQAGIKGNVMVAWIVPQERLNEVGQKCAGFPFITHCYVRETAPDWPYNFYTMIHAKSEDECLNLVKKLTEELALKDYELLFTKKEIVRRMRRYFSEEI